MKKATPPSLAKLVDAAFKQAAEKAVERARQTGTPLILWEDGGVKEVKPPLERKQRRPKRSSHKRR